MRVELHAQTDVGRVRQGNEDNFLVLDLTTERSWTGSDPGARPPDGLSRFECGPRGAVLAVSDGMGGALAGDVEMLQDLIVAAVNEAGRKVDEAMKGKLGGMLPPGLL